MIYYTVPTKRNPANCTSQEDKQSGLITDKKKGIWKKYDNIFMYAVFYGQKFKN